MAVSTIDLAGTAATDGDGWGRLSVDVPTGMIEQLDEAKKKRAMRSRADLVRAVLVNFLKSEETGGSSTPHFGSVVTSGGVGL